MANRVRFYLRRVTDYAMHDLETVQYKHIEVDVPALAAILEVDVPALAAILEVDVPALAAILRSETEYPWFVVGVELVEERNDDE